MMRQRIAFFREEEEGQGMAEYGFVVTLVAIAAMGAFSFLGNRLTTVISSVGSAVTP